MLGILALPIYLIGVILSIVVYKGGEEYGEYSDDGEFPYVKVVLWPFTLIDTVGDSVDRWLDSLN